MDLNKEEENQDQTLLLKKKSYIAICFVYKLVFQECHHRKKVMLFTESGYSNRYKQHYYGSPLLVFTSQFLIFSQLLFKTSQLSPEQSKPSNR